MSVDDRLREAFGETDDRWEQLAPASLGLVRGRLRRQHAVRRGSATVLATAAAVAAVAVAQAPGHDRDPSPAPSPTSPTGVVTPPAERRAGSPLDGTWISRPITATDVRRAARDAGDPGAADAMLAQLPDTPFRLVLTVDTGGNSTALKFRTPSGDEVADEENIEMSGSRVALRPRFGPGVNVHRWDIEDGVLHLSFVSSSEGATDGVPGEAFQRLLYDTVAFTR